MNATDFYWGIGDALEAFLSLIYDEKNMITTVFNTTVILGGFFGLFYWLRLQKKFNEQAKNNPNQLK
jgi:hypothetical protein